MPQTKVKPKGKTPVTGKGLKKKVGPLPLFAWLGIAGVVIFIIYLRSRSARSSTTGVDSTATVTPTAGLTPQQSASAGTGGADSTGGFDPALLNGLFPPGDYVTQTDLQSQLDALGSELTSTIAGVTFTAPADMPRGTAVGPSQPSQKPAQAPQVGNTVRKLASGATITTTPTGKKIEQAPGKSPYVIASGKGAPAPARTIAQTATKYFTYKKDVKLGSGQSLHFTSGKGYFAA